MTVCVIPTYRAAETICSVILGVLQFVDLVVVVDDACPEESGLIVQAHFKADSRVEVLHHRCNRGVGAATKTGFRRCLQIGADFIVKVDADGQMDPACIPQMVEALRERPQVALVKGNRFIDGSVTRVMPVTRLVGNSMLTLLVRATTGYWNGIDPTNGYFVVRGSVLDRLRIDRLADRYFFEISFQVLLGIRRAEIAEVEIAARYGGGKSSLSIWRSLATFPFALATAFARRLVWQYFIADMNVGSLFLLGGTILTLFAIVMGVVFEIQSMESNIPRTAGTVTIVIVPFIFGFQLLLNAVLFDVQSATRVHKVQGKLRPKLFEMKNERQDEQDSVTANIRRG